MELGIAVRPKSCTQPARWAARVGPIHAQVFDRCRVETGSTQHAMLRRSAGESLAER